MCFNNQLRFLDAASSELYYQETSVWTLTYIQSQIIIGSCIVSYIHVATSMPINEGNWNVQCYVNFLMCHVFNLLILVGAYVHTEKCTICIQLAMQFMFIIIFVLKRSYIQIIAISYLITFSCHSSCIILMNVLHIIPEILSL